MVYYSQRFLRSTFHRGKPICPRQSDCCPKFQTAVNGEISHQKICYPHSSLGIGVSSFAALDAVLPPAGVGIAILVVESPFAVPPAVLIEAFDKIQNLNPKWTYQNSYRTSCRWSFQSRASCSRRSHRCTRHRSSRCSGPCHIFAIEGLNRESRK